MIEQLPGSPLRVIPGLCPAPRAVARPAIGTKQARRGVRLADYTIDGCRVLEVISSRGERLGGVPIRPEVDEEIVREWLCGYLEGIDPLPAAVCSA